MVNKNLGYMLDTLSLSVKATYYPVKMTMVMIIMISIKQTIYIHS